MYTDMLKKPPSAMRYSPLQSIGLPSLSYRKYSNFFHAPSIKALVKGSFLLIGLVVGSTRISYADVVYVSSMIDNQHEGDSWAAFLPYVVVAQRLRTPIPEHMCAIH
jgi:hypothetical protein